VAVKKKKAPKKKSAEAAGAPVGSGEGRITITVEAHKVGLLIGPGGAMIKQLNELSGASIDISKSDQGSSAPVAIVISGPGDPARARRARSAA
jgi:transcription antitermination factor NusA-like protein